MKTLLASASCSTCDTLFERLPVERDDDGGYVLVPQKQCPACGALLCPNCEQFACDGCNRTFCASHMLIIPDGTDSPLRCCAVCAVEALQLPLPVEACVGCHGIVTLAHSQTTDLFGTWHTACQNASIASVKAYQQERDECEGFTFREPPELPARRPLAMELARASDEGTEVA